MESTILCRVAMTKEPCQDWELRASKHCVSSSVCTTSAEVGVHHRGRMLLQRLCHVLWRDLILQFRTNKDKPSLPDSEESGGLSSREHMENEAAPQLDVAFESWEQSMHAGFFAEIRTW